MTGPERKKATANPTALGGQVVRVSSAKRLASAGTAVGSPTFREPVRVSVGRPCGESTGVSRAMTDEEPSKPMRRIDDATYGIPPESGFRRRLVRVRRWFQLDADRRLVTAFLLCMIFVTIVLVGSYGPVSVHAFLTEGISPGSALVELLKTIVSVVVIVLSINQLVLSPGLGPVGEQEERFDQSVDLRRRVEEHSDQLASPSSPAAFLEHLLAEILRQASVLEAVTAEAESDLSGRTTEFVEAVTEEGESVRRFLASSRFGEFEAVSAVLRFAISEKVRALRAIQRAHGESFDETTAEAFDQMDDLLEIFTVAREYLKTVYIRAEYISLSESLLYSGLPAIVVTYCAAQIYAPTVFPGKLLGFEKRLLFVAGAVTVSLTPFVVLVAYVFRLTAMSRSTLFVGPFAARDGHEE